MTKEQVIELVRKATNAFERIEELPQLVIAAINGNVFAGGRGTRAGVRCPRCRAACEASACRKPNGVGSRAGGPLRLARLVGRANALDLICTGKEIDGTQMASIGFARARRARTQDFDSSVQQYILDIAGNGPLAIRGAKQIMKVDE